MPDSSPSSKGDGPHPTPEQIAQALERSSGNVAAAARELGMTRDRLRHMIKRQEGHTPQGEPPDPADYENDDLWHEAWIRWAKVPSSLRLDLDKARVTASGRITGPLKRVVDLDNKPAPTRSPSRPSKPASVPTTADRLVRPGPYLPRRPEVIVKPGQPDMMIAVLSDHHAPHVDWDLHDLSVAMIEWAGIMEVIINGDLLNLSTMAAKKLKRNLYWTDTPNECLIGGVRVLTDLARVANVRVVLGNHEQRLEDYEANRDPINGAIRIGGDGPRAQGLYTLLKMEKLGVELIEQQGYGDYRYSVVPVIEGVLNVGHASDVREGAHDTAIAKVKRSGGVGWVLGGSHRLSSTSVSVTDEGTMTTKRAIAAEGGCMCDRSGGLGHAGPMADWHQGFLVIVVRDGVPTIEEVPYVDGAIHWRGKRWRKIDGKIIMD